MRGYVGLTDFDWYTQLLGFSALDEVNFWRPSGASFKAVRPGEWFFFRLKKPHYAIAGFGRFARHLRLPVWLAWELFGTKNGVQSLVELEERVRRYRRRNRTPADGLLEIGCTMIAEPVFFPKELWVREPSGFSRNIVAGKTFDTTAGEGQRVLADCFQRALALEQTPLAASPTLPFGGFGKPVMRRPRIGQGTFKAALLDAYGRQCAVSREHSLPVLEAAHIRPFSQTGRHDVREGVVLRADVHRLFDRGYVTITPDLDFVVSSRLMEDFGNGKDYLGYQGKIVVPRAAADRPDLTALEWHRDEVFLGC